MTTHDSIDSLDLNSANIPDLAGGSKGPFIVERIRVRFTSSKKTSFRVARQPEHSVWPQSSQLNRNPSALSQLHLFFFLKGCGKAKSIRVPFCLKHSTQRHICIYLVLVGQCRLVGAKQNDLQGIIWAKYLFSIFSLLVGILFTMLVFGPACGFILGSFCTKIYVDAVFIDTSKEKGDLLKIKCIDVLAWQYRCVQVGCCFSFHLECPLCMYIIFRGFGFFIYFLTRIQLFSTSSP